ncbi:MAG TPA: hypothetical protein P5511_06455, partial [Candidatus Goldiibacteriota bacterium]|nr:hypothetical protein [Candidatus Goldiibacteriota bacterium]
MYLPGINIGGYLSQAKLTKHHLDTFISEKDFRIIKSWGLKLVRLPVDYFLFEDEKYPFAYNLDRVR